MTDQQRLAYRVCEGVTHVNGEPVTVDTVWLTAAEAAFDVAHGRIHVDPAAPRRGRRRRIRKGRVDGRD